MNCVISYTLQHFLMSDRYSSHPPSDS
uniref:Uncharacterized protein n=1 Tax=Anguilla anguilla TaxID=7936 RepID=A0A0E9S8L3_ANGAN